jgi:hypothetical protein
VGVFNFNADQAAFLKNLLEMRLIDLSPQLKHFYDVVYNGKKSANTIGDDDAAWLTGVSITSRKPKGDYFSDAELFGHKKDFDPDLLDRINVLREEWGKPIVVSPLKGAVIRWDNSGSYHNINKWGKVRAIDFFPQSRKGPGGIKSVDEAIEFILLARAVGLTGIGVYPYFTPSYGFHVDNRENPCEWVDTAKYPNHNYFYGNATWLLKQRFD